MKKNKPIHFLAASGERISERLRNLMQKKRERHLAKMTNPERIGCEILRQIREHRGVRFEFQQPIVYSEEFYFFLDFYLLDYRVGIEIDGRSHTTELGRAKDEIRTRMLEQMGIKLLRLQNEDMLGDRRIVEEKILQFCQTDGHWLGARVSNRAARMKGHR